MFSLPRSTATSSVRIAQLDCVRGIAILGIICLNIVGFALPKMAYLNPSYTGIPTLADSITWIVLTIFAQGKFLAMLTLLFGAGLQCLRARGVDWVQHRLRWLVFFGLMHSIFFWDGDILFAYGLVGLLSCRMIFAAHSSRELFLAGGSLFIIGLILLLIQAMIAPTTSSFWYPEYTALSAESFWKVQGGWLAWYHRLILLANNLWALINQYGWQLSGLMLCGAGLMRNGWLAGDFSLGKYRRQGGYCLFIGLLIQLPTTLLEWYLNWDYFWSIYWLRALSELASLLMMMGYLALFYWFWPVLAQGVKKTLAQLGKMSLSNYFLQTLLCTLFFYHFKQFDRWSRTELLLTLPVLWGSNLLFTRFWLSYFSQGPLEWLWRKLIQLTTGSPIISIIMLFFILKQNETVFFVVTHFT